MTQDIITKIAVLGGTGSEGSGLALRWAHAGYDVAIGSRQAEKAQQAAAQITQKLDTGLIHGMSNAEAAAWADIVVLSVPYAAHTAILEQVKPAVQGKILVDVTVPLDPSKPQRVRLLPAGPAALEAQQLLGDEVQVVAAFQNVGAAHLAQLGYDIDCDVLVCGNDQEAKRHVIRLAQAAGMYAWDAGPIENAAVVEGLTSVLIHINIQHKTKAAGIRITSVPR
jgi:NADPH-dependent F420 reductase